MSLFTSKLKTGYYVYRPHQGVTFLDTHLYYNELPTDCVFVMPHIFHQIINDFDSYESTPIICAFKQDDSLLMDLCDSHTIRGLYES